MARFRTVVSNAYFVAGPGSAWVLIDSGTPGDAKKICQSAEARYGAGARPVAIVLTHGHFDHAGSALDLARTWNVPVYAHAAEAPFLTGKSAYPPKDPTVGGCMGLLSRFFPGTTSNLGDRLRLLPPDGEVPGLPEWRWYHTPGHAPGHVCFFHERHSILLAGDALTTVDLSSCVAIALQSRKICGPPAPFTFDWEQARKSVEVLAGLRPFHLGCGHGAPMSGEDVAHGLDRLAAHFPVPPHGRYSATPARTDQHGLAFVPPAVRDRLPVTAAAIGAGIVAGSVASLLARRSLRRARQRAVTSDGPEA